MEKITPKKAKSSRFKDIVTGGLTCPHCHKWLCVQLTEKLVVGTVLCPECYKPMLLDIETCIEINKRNTRTRKLLFYPQIRRTIYEGYKNGTGK